MPSLRQIYLSSVWNPYPEVPERSHSVGGWLKRYGSEVTPEFTQPLRIVGKLCQISFREKMLVLAQTGKKLTLVVNGPAKWEESSPQDCLEEPWRDPFLVLVPGDVVMVEIHDWKWDAIRENIKRTCMS